LKSRAGLNRAELQIHNIAVLSGQPDGPAGVFRRGVPPYLTLCSRHALREEDGMPDTRLLSAGILFAVSLSLPVTSSSSEAATEIAATPCSVNAVESAAWNRRLIQSVLCQVIEDVGPTAFVPRTRRPSLPGSPSPFSMGQSTHVATGTRTPGGAPALVNRHLPAGRSRDDRKVTDESAQD
jgi:hypothetical protein